ncbi:hypothetical protein CCACVL1_02959, partial [Corchorus capsularis]
MTFWVVGLLMLKVKVDLKFRPNQDEKHSACTSKGTGPTQQQVYRPKTRTSAASTDSAITPDQAKTLAAANAPEKTAYIDDMEEDNPLTTASMTTSSPEIHPTHIPPDKPSGETVVMETQLDDSNMVD